MRTTIKCRAKMFCNRVMVAMVKLLAGQPNLMCRYLVFRATGRPWTCYFIPAIYFRNGIRKGLLLPFMALPIALPIHRPGRLYVLFLLKKENQPVHGRFLRMVLPA